MSPLSVVCVGTFHGLRKHEFNIGWHFLHSNRCLTSMELDMLMFLLCSSAPSLKHLPIWPMYTCPHAIRIPYTTEPLHVDTDSLCCFPYFGLSPTKSVRRDNRKLLENMTSIWHLDTRALKLFKCSRKVRMARRPFFVQTFWSSLCYFWLEKDKICFLVTDNQNFFLFLLTAISAYIPVSGNCFSCIWDICLSPCFFVCTLLP